MKITQTRQDLMFNANKHCPDLQLTTNHILNATSQQEVTKNGMSLTLRDPLGELLYSPDAPNSGGSDQDFRRNLSGYLLHLFMDTRTTDICLRGLLQRMPELLQP
ncbi:hypothetical protein TNCV_2620011, partial [Trichonephila clavipes]